MGKMIIGGLQKTTLIDFPGKIACTVFTAGCNFRCPWCFNAPLVRSIKIKNEKLKMKNDNLKFKIISNKDFFDFLERRKGLLDGVVVSGGEPTVQEDLEEFLKKVKAMGFRVKLDTNGSRPKVVRRLVEEGLVDYIALDYKVLFGKYELLRNPKSEIRNSKQIRNSKSQIPNERELGKTMEETIGVLMGSGVEFELRTTVVPTVHTKGVLVLMAEQLREVWEGDRSKMQNDNAKCKIIELRWFLQKFRPGECLEPSFNKIEPYSEKEMRRLMMVVRRYVAGVKLRGN